MPFRPKVSALIALLAALPPIAWAQDKAAPQAVPFTGSIPVAYKLKVGEADRYVMTNKSKGEVEIGLAGQPMRVGFATDSTMEMVVKCIEGAGPYKVQATPDKLKLDMKIDQPMGSMTVQVRDKRLKIMQGEQVMADSETGEGQMFLDMFGKQVGFLGKSVTGTVESTGKMATAWTGDAALTKMLAAGQGGGCFGVVFAGPSTVKVGDEWDHEVTLTELQMTRLNKPVKVKAHYKVLGVAIVDGQECLDIAGSWPGTFKDLEGSMEQGGAQMAMKIKRLQVKLDGHVYFDHKAGRIARMEAKGAVAMEGSMEMPGAGSVDMTMELPSSVLLTRTPAK